MRPSVPHFRSVPLRLVRPWVQSGPSDRRPSDRRPPEVQSDPLRLQFRPRRSDPWVLRRRRPWVQQRPSVPSVLWDLQRDPWAQQDPSGRPRDPWAPLFLQVPSDPWVQPQKTLRRSGLWALHYRQDRSDPSRQRRLIRRDPSVRAGLSDRPEFRGRPWGQQVQSDLSQHP